MYFIIKNEIKTYIFKIKFMKDIVIYREKILDEKLDISEYVWKYNEIKNGKSYKCILCDKYTNKITYTLINKAINIYLPYCSIYCSINNIYIIDINDFLENKIQKNLNNFEDEYSSNKNIICLK